MSDKIIFIAPAYYQYPMLIPSLQLQSHKRWELLLIHDGPNDRMRPMIQNINDHRIHYHETHQRHNDFGHSLRQYGLDLITEHNMSCDYIVITDASNYYVPGFCGLMLQQFSSDIMAVYCNILHSYLQWNIMETALSVGKIDCGCLMVRKQAAAYVGFKSRRYEAEWDYIQSLLSEYTHAAFAKINTPLFIHNSQ